MTVCEVCKTENEEHFTFCKNCGLPIKKEEVKPQVKPQVQPQEQPEPREELVSVYMMLPDIADPTKRTLQKVFVTKEQFNAMKLAGMFEKKEENNV